MRSWLFARNADLAVGSRIRFLQRNMFGEHDDWITLVLQDTFRNGGAVSLLGDDGVIHIIPEETPIQISQTVGGTF